MMPSTTAEFISYAQGHFDINHFALFTGGRRLAAGH
jgi:hypothetical protein